MFTHVLDYIRWTLATKIIILCTPLLDSEYTISRCMLCYTYIYIEPNIPRFKKHQRKSNIYNEIMQSCCSKKLYITTYVIRWKRETIIEFLQFKILSVVRYINLDPNFKKILNIDDNFRMIISEISQLIQMTSLLLRNYIRLDKYSNNNSNNSVSSQLSKYVANLMLFSL